jgi:hypothetical protein
VARVAVGLALFIVASEIVFLTEGEISSVERFHVGPGADRLATATVIAWPIVVIAVILIMGQRLSVATPHRGQVAYQVARQLCIIGMPLATAAVATMTFGEESLGMSMVNGAATVLAAAAVLGTLSTAIRRSRIQ